MTSCCNTCQPLFNVVTLALSPGSTTQTDPLGSIVTISGFPGSIAVNEGGIGIGNNGNFTIPITGNYLISASINLTSQAVANNTTVNLYIFQTNVLGNSTIIVQNTQPIPQSNTTITVSVTIGGTANLSIGDVITFGVSTLNSTFVVNIGSFFYISRLIANYC